MTVVSSKEFSANQDKYFDIALDEQVYIQKGNSVYLLVYKDVDNMNIYSESNNYTEILEPDDDLRRAITGEELLERIYKDIDKKFASRIQ
jgi:hypothetical protein